jgi:hypothetical protein
MFKESEKMELKGNNNKKTKRQFKKEVKEQKKEF